MLLAFQFASVKTPTVARLRKQLSSIAHHIALRRVDAVVVAVRGRSGSPPCCVSGGNCSLACYDSRCAVPGFAAGGRDAWAYGEEGDSMSRFFPYGEEEVAYLKSRDAKLAAAIDAVGHVDREMMDEGDLFAGVVHHIVGQQISSAALATVWGRLRDIVGDVTPAAVCAVEPERLQACGITFKKTGYIKGFAEKVWSGAFDLAAVEHMSDAEAIAALGTIDGVGEWTAEMLLLFCLGRPDILSFGDLAIHRGMRMVYHHRKVTRALFEKYRRRYSPYGSVASLYLWAVSHGGVPGFERDYAPRKPTRRSRV